MVFISCLFRNVSESSSKEQQPSELVRPNYALLRSSIRTDDMEYDSDAGKRYGHVPRMRRIQVNNLFMGHRNFVAFDLVT